MLVLPLVLAAGVSACANSGGVSPGVQTAGYGSTQGTTAGIGESGRVVSIRDIDMRGGAGSGGGRGTFTGGMIGAGAGGMIGGMTSRSWSGGLIGALLGAVGGAIAGNIYDRHGGVGRGIEVVVQKDDGQTMTIAQKDDGDVQLGDRVMVVADRNGVARAVRDTTNRAD
ncbi:MAG TPA: hypothetical protein VEC14_16665 [Reyranellaceae bacterium]|nr:hypothetical protein [Reyranellaceae bacterium]